MKSNEKPQVVVTFAASGFVGRMLHVHEVPGSYLSLVTIFSDLGPCR